MKKGKLVPKGTGKPTGMTGKLVQKKVKHNPRAKYS